MTHLIRIGILNDLAAAPPSPTDIEQWLRSCVDELIRSRRIAGQVEFINAWGLGLPSGTAQAVERAYQTLVEANAHLIVGPAIGDNALIATSLAERARVPTINWAGAERARGEYMFHLQVGSHEDESIVLARHLSELGVSRVGVIFDRSTIGERHVEFLVAEAAILDLDIVASKAIAPLADSAEEQVHDLLQANVDAVVYLGLGISAVHVARALVARDFTGPRLMNTAGLRGYAPEFARQIDGWMYVDMHSDSNTTLRMLCERQRVAPRRRLAAAKGFDLGRLVAEAIARATSPTRDGIKEGLEQIKWLPAAEGHEGTLLGFGNFDRGALHGRYLVMRQWREGQTIELV